MAPREPAASPPRPALALGLGFNVLLLSAVSFLTDASSEILFPLLPLFIISAEAGGLGLGATLGPLVVGLTEGLREATASLLKVFSGHWSDRLGRRKLLVVGGYSLSGLVKIAFPFVALWPPLVALAVAERVGKGLRDAPRDAILAEGSPPGVRGKVFGFHRMADTLGAAVGPLVALLLFGPLGFRGVFLVATIPATLSALLVVLVREPQRSAPRPSPLRVSLAGLRPGLRFFIAVATVFTAGNFSIFFLLVRVVAGAEPEGAEGFVAAVREALALYLAFNVAYASTAIPAGILSDRAGRLPPILVGYGAFLLAALGFAAAAGSPWPLLLPLFLLFGIAYGLVEGVQRALVADLAPPTLRATSLGAYHTATGLAKFPASFIFGGLWVLWGPAASFGYAAGAAATALLLLLVMMRRFPRAVLAAEGVPPRPATGPGSP